MSHDLLINKNKVISELFQSTSHMEIEYLLPLLAGKGVDRKLESIITQRLENRVLPIPGKELSEAVLAVCKGSGSVNKSELDEYTEIVLNSLQRLGVEASKEECIFDLETKLLVKFFGEKLEEHPVFKREKLEKTSIFGEPIVGFKSFEDIFPSNEVTDVLSVFKWLVRNKSIDQIYKSVSLNFDVGVVALKPFFSIKELSKKFKKRSESYLDSNTILLILHIAFMRQIQIAFDFQRYSYELRSCI